MSDLLPLSQIRSTSWNQALTVISTNTQAILKPEYGAIFRQIS
jgi:hypothetical protein